MGRLKNQLKYQSSNRRSFFSKTSELDLASQIIIEKYSSPTSLPDALELEAVFQQLMSYVSAGNFDEIPKRLWKRSTWVFWHDKKNLLTDQKFFSELRKYINTSNPSGLIRSLASIYIREYRSRPNDVRKISELIISSLLVAESRSLSHWQNLHKSYEFFDYDKSSSNLLELLNNLHSANEFFIELGVSNEQKSIGLIEDVYLNFLKTFSGKLERNEDRIKHFGKFIDFSFNGQSLRFPQHKIKIIESLLLPWISKKPDEELQNKITKFLIDSFGDLRIKPQNWIGVSDSAKAIFKKWLSGAALKQFFEIISDYQEDGEWEYRKAFWMAYYNDDLIDDVWVIFKRRHYNETKNRLDENLGFGIVDSNGKSVAAIIIKIGSFIFSEWSGVGKCRAWNENDSRAPRLYKNSYSEHELKAISRDEIIHRSSKIYRWQLRLSTFIYENVGVSMPSFKYKLR